MIACTDAKHGYYSFLCSLPSINPQIGRMLAAAERGRVGGGGGGCPLLSSLLWCMCEMFLNMKSTQTRSRVPTFSQHTSLALPHPLLTYAALDCQGMNNFPQCHAGEKQESESALAPMDQPFRICDPAVTTTLLLLLSHFMDTLGPSFRVEC